MPTTRRNPPTAGLDPGENRGGDSAPDGLELALAELGQSCDGGMVRVNKYSPEHKSSTGWAACCRVAWNEFDPFAIVRLYGEGKYRFVFVDAESKIRRSVDWVALAPGGSSSPAMGLPTGVGTAPAPAGPDPVLRMMELHADFLQKLLLALLAKDGAGGAQGFSPADMVALVREGREGATQPTPPLELISETISTGMELGRAAASAEGGGGGSMLETFGPKVLGLIETLLEKHAPAAGGTAPAIAAPSSPQAASTDPPPPVMPHGAAPPPPGNGDALQGILRQYVPRVLAEASSGRDPHVWGIFIAERTPEAWLPQLTAIATADPIARAGMLTEIDPQCAQYIPWFDDACEGIREALYGAPPGEDDDAGDTPAPAGAQTLEVDPNAAGGDVPRPATPEG